MRIAVLPGDGIAHEIMPVCLSLLADVTVAADSFQLTAAAARAFAPGDLIPCELGGSAGTARIGEAIRTGLGD